MSATHSSGNPTRHTSPVINPGTARRWQRQERMRALIESAEAESEIDALGRAVSIMTLQGRPQNADTGRSSVSVTPSSVQREDRKSSVGLRNFKDRVALLEDRLLNDLGIIQSDLRRRLLSFSPDTRSLVFSRNPLSTAPEESSVEPPECNSGSHALDTSNPNNRTFLEHESWIFTTRATVQAMDPCGDPDVDSIRGSLLSQLQHELTRLAEVKHLEWERQTTIHDSYVAADAHRVDNERYFTAQSELWSKHVVIQATYILVLLLHLVYGLPRRASQVLLVGIQCIIRLSLQFAHDSLDARDERLLKRLARDPQTVIGAFDLEPSVKSYICCPDCYALYDHTTSAPATCTYRATAESSPCNTKLWRNRNTGPSSLPSPVRQYLHQSLKQWIGRLLSRPDIQDYLERIPEDAPGPMKDIFDGEILRSFRGADGQLFLSARAGEVRLIFSLNVDGFNPLQMKEGKQTATSTAMYMACLNLPPHLRYLSENIYVAGVVPGPNKPSIDQINHFLALIVDELLMFWEPGVEYSRSAKFKSGCRVYAALVPLVSDILAARQVAGLGPHNHTYFCSFCRLKSEDIENLDPHTWPPRDVETHRRSADEWRSARNMHEREAIFERTGGIRYSELLRLPYWDPIRHVIVDSMHNLYLGILKNHIREIWGISVDLDDGDAKHARKTPPPRPDAQAMANAVHCLYHGNQTALKECGKPALWHLCADRDLRRAGTVKQLMKALLKWRTREGFPIPAKHRANPTPNQLGPSSTSDSQSSTSNWPGAPAQVQPIPTSSHSPIAIPAPAPRALGFPHGQVQRVPTAEELEKAERTFSKASKMKTLENMRKDILVSMCERRGLPVGGIKADVAKRLMDWRESQSALTNLEAGELGLSRPQVSGPKARSPSDRSKPQDNQGKVESKAPSPNHAIGRQTLAEFRKDRERMQLPSWVTPAPMNFGTTQHGKLSADQWRTVGTISLPVTLIRTWGLEEGRRLEMLQNFMDAVDAIELFGLREIDTPHIEAAAQSLRRYLNCLVLLYKEAKIQPNHHLAMHLPDFLLLYGPVHSWRTFAFERFNHILQSINTNRNFGELEMTFMRYSCRAANLRPLLQHSAVQNALADAIHIHERSFQETRRGTRLDDIFRGAKDTEIQGDPGKKRNEIWLDGQEFNLLLQRLNLEQGGHRYVDERQKIKPPGASLLTRLAISCTRIVISGVEYKSRDDAPKDSNIIFRLPAVRTSPAGRIKLMFLHKRSSSVVGSMVEETFLVVEQLVELNDTDALLDNFRKFKYTGGRLCYDRYEQMHIIRPQDVVCHFAKTPMDDLKLSQPCVHIRPLDRLQQVVDLSTLEDDIMEM